MQRLERHAKSLSEARTEDKKHIQNLERELLNCSQEIGDDSYSSFCASYTSLSFFDKSSYLHLLLFTIIFF